MMTKEKFLFELTDNYLYLVSLGCMVIENYILRDRTPDYIICANNLQRCLDFYEHICDELDKNTYCEQEADSILECLIQSLRQETLESIDKELRECVRAYLPDTDQFFEEYFIHNKEGSVQELTASVLFEFIRHLRETETIYAKRK